MKSGKTPYRLLVQAGMNELLRDPKLLFFTVFFPLVFLIIFGSVSLIIPKSEVLQITFLEYMFPGIMIFALVSTGFYGTALPLVELRMNGTMVLFHLSPLKIRTFMAAQITVRMVIALFQVILYLIIGLILGVIDWMEVIPLFVVSMIGMLMILVIGFLLGGLFRKVEIAGGVLGAISVPLLIFSGVLMPFYIMPDIVQKIALAIPFTYLGESMRQIMFEDIDAMFSIYVNIGFMLAFSIILFLITQRTFRWMGETEK
jgi:ABC-2 type transport system permease protein